MVKLPTLIRVAAVLTVLGLLVVVSGGGGASWAASGQDAERQTVPTRTPTPKPVTPTPPSPTPPPPATPTSLPALVTASKETDVHSGPGIDYAVVGSLEAGDTAVVLGRNVDSSWWQIRFQGDEAWVADAAVTASPEAHSAPVVSAPPLDEVNSTPKTLPRAGGGMTFLWGSVFLALSGALLLLTGSRARQRRR